MVKMVNCTSCIFCYNFFLILENKFQSRFQATPSDSKAYVPLQHIIPFSASHHSVPLLKICAVWHYPHYNFFVYLWPDINIGIFLSQLWQKSPILSSLLSMFLSKVKDPLSRSHPRVKKGQGNLCRKHHSLYWKGSFGGRGAAGYVGEVHKSPKRKKIILSTATGRGS